MFNSSTVGRLSATQPARSGKQLNSIDGAEEIIRHDKTVITSGHPIDGDGLGDDAGLECPFSSASWHESDGAVPLHEDEE